MAEYRITEIQYKMILKSQDGLCDLCQKPLGLMTVIHLDHNHVTGKVRGILHRECNLKLATIEDVEFRMKALAYLEKHSAAN